MQSSSGSSTLHGRWDCLRLAASYASAHSTVVVITKLDPGEHPHNTDMHQQRAAVSAAAVEGTDETPLQ